MLEALGLTGGEERVFRVLVDGYHAVPAEIAARLGLGVPEAQQVLDALVAKRLVSRTGEHYVPAPPDVALGPLLLQGQSRLERARATVTELAELYRGTVRRRDPAQLIEVVTGAEAIRQQALSLQRDAREELLWFCREAPIAMPASENDEEFRALARGVRFRVVYETALLEESGAAGSVAEGLRRGERARTIAKLPVRLAVADRSLALCPLADDETTGEPTAALVLGSSLVTGLVALFESYWERASPLRLDGAPGDAPLSAGERTLLSLLVGGVSDKSIAKQLGISPRTLQRRLQDLMQRSAASSRMQLAWQVAKLGWLD